MKNSLRVNFSWVTAAFGRYMMVDSQDGEKVPMTKYLCMRDTTADDTCKVNGIGKVYKWLHSFDVVRDGQVSLPTQMQMRHLKRSSFSNCRRRWIMLSTQKVGYIIIVCKEYLWNVR